MAKQTQVPAEIAPSLTKEKGRQALAVMREKGQKLLANRPISKATFNTWDDSTIDYIEKIFGSRIGHSHLINFIGQRQNEAVGYGGGPDDSFYESQRARYLEHGISVLTNIIEQLETEMMLEAPQSLIPVFSNDALWSLLHAKTVTSAKTRFDAGHYADAVEAAFKELNIVVKDMVRKKTGQEFDGASLMMKAFSPNPPVLVALDDVSTASGRDIQQGYMQIFAGSMTGIRNPKAHGNLNITREQGIHLLFLASLLFHKLDESS